MKLMDLFSFLPLSIQQKLAHIYIDRQLKKKVTINIKGQQHLDSISSPCIFIANHLSNLDGIVLMRLLKKKFDPHFVAGVKLSDDKFTNFFKTLIKTIDIKPNSADLESMKRIINTLKGGESVMIFPEGTRSRTGSLNEAKKGITLIARMSKAPIVPIALMGTEEVVPIDPGNQMSKERFHEGTVDLIIGKPFHLVGKNPGEDRHEYDERALNQIMGQIAKNLRPAYQGVYSDLVSKIESTSADNEMRND